MRRVVDAAEADVRDRMERKVLKAASAGYTKGVAAGRQAEAQESRASKAREKAPSMGDADPSAARDGARSSVDDFSSVFSEDSAAVATGSEARGETSAGAPPAAAVRVPAGDSAKEPSVGAPAGDDELSNPTPGTMPPDAGRMPTEVVVGGVLGTEGKTYAARRRGGSKRGAPTAALWALSVSARDGKLPGVREDALDLIASRCQLFFAHDKLSRATLGWAAARWRLACGELRHARAAAAHLRRRGARRALARSFAAWAGRGGGRRGSREREETRRRVRPRAMGSKAVSRRMDPTASAAREAFLCGTGTATATGTGTRFSRPSRRRRRGWTATLPPGWWTRSTS